MKKITLYTLTLALFAFSGIVKAQGYFFTLLDNGNYSYTIAAVSDFDSGSFQPITQSYGITIELPNGVDLGVTEVLPSGASETVTFVDGSNLSGLSGVDSNVGDFDYFFINTEIPAVIINAHTSGETINLLTFTVNGSPSSGQVRLVDNNSSPASSSALNGALDSFFQVDTEDDGSVTFANRYLGQTGNSTYGFSTLSDEELSLEAISLYPNPVKDILHIKGLENVQIQNINITDVTGKTILRYNTGYENINLSAMNSGIYFVNVSTENSNTVFKIIKD